MKVILNSLSELAFFKPPLSIGGGLEGALIIEIQ